MLPTLPRQFSVFSVSDIGSPLLPRRSCLPSDGGIVAGDGRAGKSGGQGRDRCGHRTDDPVAAEALGDIELRVGATEGGRASFDSVPTTAQSRSPPPRAV